MEFVAATLGLDGIASSKRALIMRPATAGAMLCMVENDGDSLPKTFLDDDTASTMSSLEEYESFSASSSSMVSFVDEMVTAVYLRPATTATEKRDLFYNDSDYRRFRYEFYHHQQQQRRRTRETTVQFCPTVVTKVHSYEDDYESQKEDLFYSEKDLQRFLDEFVSSLHATCM